MLRPLVLLAPSQAAALELPRRLASTGLALAGVYPFKLLELARVIAEPELLGRGLAAWDPGHMALLAGRLLDGSHALRLPAGLPRAPMAHALARTLIALRRAGVEPIELQALAAQSARHREDQERLGAVAGFYQAFHEALEGRVADPRSVLETAGARVAEATWLTGGEALIVDDLDLAPPEQAFLAALARRMPVRRLRQTCPPSLEPSSFGAWAAGAGIASVSWEETPFAPLSPKEPPAGLARLRETLFEPPTGKPVDDGSVELLTAPGEPAEARAIARRLLREAARGVPFEEMGVLLGRPETYAPIFTELFERLRIPCRLHPSLPLGTGRTARALLLLFRCRGLARPAVMEFLTFVPAPFAELLGDLVQARTSQWDAISRDAGIVSELARWILGLRAHAEAEREAAAREEADYRRERRLGRAADAETLLRVVELLASTLEALSGEAPWAEWSARLVTVLDQWIRPGLPDRQAVRDVIADLASLAPLAPRAPWSEVEQVLEARFESERMPLVPITTGAVHVGVLDALAGLPFRFVAIPGLVEGGFPGVLRPDPFLLDADREALARAQERPAAGEPTRGHGRGARQLSLFAANAPGSATPEAAPSAGQQARLATTQDRLIEARRAFHGAVRQATERLVLAYPRADPRTGRERLPSLFLVAAASSLLGRPASALDLEARLAEDRLETLPLNETLDASERDRKRVREGGEDAAQAVAAGSPFFKQSRLASRARWSSRFTRYDGYLGELPGELLAKLDPAGATAASSASRLATFARCGFLYLLQHVLRLEPAVEPEERRRLDPLERGTLFHEVAESFLRERRDRGELPVKDTQALRQRLEAMAEAALEGFVAGSPPRFTLLWEREKRLFKQTLGRWLAREAASAERGTPAYFEVGFGLPGDPGSNEPHSREPLVIELGEGRVIKVAGKIDRIDRRADGTLLLRDYKTGKAPRDDGGIFRGGKQLQIPFYVLAAARLFPEHPVTEAFLDYVDGGRQVAWDPAAVTGETFRKFLAELLDVIAHGIFAQEPSSCDFCDFKAACGPKALIEARRAYKTGDRNLQRALRLKDVL